MSQAEAWTETVCPQQVGLQAPFGMMEEAGLCGRTRPFAPTPRCPEGGALGQLPAVTVLHERATCSVSWRGRSGRVSVHVWGRVPTVP